MAENKMIVIGAGGHALAVCDAIESMGKEVLGLLDDAFDAGTMVSGRRILGKVSDCLAFPEACFVIGIGNNKTRRHIAKTYALPYRAVIHKTAYISAGAKVFPGAVILAGAVIGADAVIGPHAIVNTLASADHQNEIGAYAHLSPHAALGGTVTVGEETHIGIGAAVKNNITICSHVTVGAGATVVSSITEPGVYVGTPARRLFKTEKEL